MPTPFVVRLPFTIFTYTIMHLVYPPTFCTTIVFACSQDNRNTQEKIGNDGYAILGGDGGGGRGQTRYVMVYVKWLIQKIHQSLSLSCSCFGWKVFENIIKNYFGRKAAIYTRCSIGVRVIQRPHLECSSSYKAI